MSAEYGTEPKASDFGAQGGAWADGGSDSVTVRHYEGSPERTNAENEAVLVSRRISAECDRFHHDAADAGCVNGSCQCWCAT